MTLLIFHRDGANEKVAIYAYLHNTIGVMRALVRIQSTHTHTPTKTRKKEWKKNEENKYYRNVSFQLDTLIPTVFSDLSRAE